MSAEEGKIKPDWLVHLLHYVGEAFQTLGPTMGVAYQRAIAEDGSEVLLLFQAPGEMYGGKADGVQVYAGMQMDLLRISQAFDRTDVLVWHNPAVYEKPEEGPEIRFQGDILGVPVLVKILSQPMKDAPAWMQVDTETGEIWPK